MPFFEPNTKDCPTRRQSKPRVKLIFCVVGAGQGVSSNCPYAPKRLLLIRQKTIPCLRTRQCPNARSRRIAEPARSRLALAGQNRRHTRTTDCLPDFWAEFNCTVSGLHALPQRTRPGLQATAAHGRSPGHLPADCWHLHPIFGCLYAPSLAAFVAWPDLELGYSRNGVRGTLYWTFSQTFDGALHRYKLAGRTDASVTVAVFANGCAGTDWGRWPDLHKRRAVLPLGTPAFPPRNLAPVRTGRERLALRSGAAVWDAWALNVDIAYSQDQ